MMVCTKILVLLIIAAALGAGTTLIYGELRAQPPTITNAASRSPVPTTGSSAQQRAKQKGEEQTIKSDCEALQKMGVADKDCPPEKGSK